MLCEMLVQEYHIFFPICIATITRLFFPNTQHPWLDLERLTEVPIQTGLDKAPREFCLNNGGKHAHEIWF